MCQKDTPPLSPEMEQEIDENDVVYLEDLDEEINDTEDAEMEEMEDMEENEEVQERDDAVCIFSKHNGLLIHNFR